MYNIYKSLLLYNLFFTFLQHQFNCMEMISLHFFNKLINIQIFFSFHYVQLLAIKILAI